MDQDMDDGLSEYRSGMVDSLRLLNQAYDKILVTLAGGALGLSIVFLKDIVVLDAVSGRGLLLTAWAFFIISLGAVLGRIFFGIEACRRAIAQIDDGTVREARVGGWYSVVSRGLHITSALALVVGLLSIALFAYRNVGG